MLKVLYSKKKGTTITSDPTSASVVIGTDAPKNSVAFWELIEDLLETSGHRNFHGVFSFSKESMSVNLNFNDEDLLLEKFLHYE